MDWPIGIAILMASIFTGVPIAFALAAVGVIGVISIIGFDPAMAMLGQIYFDSGRSYTYDINTNTKYNAEAEAVDGRLGMGHLAEALGREQVNEAECGGWHQQIWGFALRSRGPDSPIWISI